MEKGDFTKAFLKNKKMIGSVRPSSRFLVTKMVQNIDFDTARVIVELGPGTGVFTKSILKKMHADCKLIIFELNDEFMAHLKTEYADPRCIFVHDSAEKLETYLLQYELGKADIVVSSLPLTNFSTILRRRLLLSVSKSMVSSGKFIQFQYSLQSKTLLLQLFRSVDVRFTLWNLPPAFVFTCSNTPVF